MADGSVLVETGFCYNSLFSLNTCRGEPCRTIRSRCISGCHFREVQNCRCCGTEGRGLASQIWNLPRLILMMGLADMNEPYDVDWGEPQDVYIDCEAQWLEWIDVDTWCIYIYIIVVILWFAKFLQDCLICKFQANGQNTKTIRQHVVVPASRHLYPLLKFQGKGAMKFLQTCQDMFCHLWSFGPFW